MTKLPSSQPRRSRGLGQEIGAGQMGVVDSIVDAYRKSPVAQLVSVVGISLLCSIDIRDVKTINEDLRDRDTPTQHTSPSQLDLIDDKGCTYIPAINARVRNCAGKTLKVIQREEADSTPNTPIQQQLPSPIKFKDSNEPQKKYKTQPPEKDNLKPRHHVPRATEFEIPV